MSIEAIAVNCEGLVRLELTGAYTRFQIERSPPYMLFGDNENVRNVNVQGRHLPAGYYDLRSYPDSNPIDGALEIEFEIIECPQLKTVLGKNHRRTTFLD